jgi:hypothetical protein
MAALDMPMHPLSPRRPHRTRSVQVLRRLDRAASRLNPVLFVSAVGLGVLYITCLLALLIRLPVVPLDACKVNPAAPAADAGTPTSPPLRPF